MGRPAVTSGGGRRLWSLLGALTALAILATVLVLPGLRDQLAQSARVISPLAVLVTLPGQLVAFLLCAGALSALRPGVSFRSCLASRVLRDAGGNLLILFPGLGEAIGARALVLAGGKTRAAITASTLDVLAEGLAQVPYGILAVLVLPQLVRTTGDRTEWTEWTAGNLPMIFVLVGLLVIAAVAGWAAIRRGGNAPAGILGRIRAEAYRLRVDWASRRRGTAIAIGLHLLAWSVGGIQLWAAARALGLPLNLFEAIVVESAAYAVRAVIFFVPAGLAVQEATLVVACAAFGIGTVEALALALVLRLRDVICGLPLLYWPLLEYQHRARSRAEG